MQDRILVAADGTARREFDDLGPWPDQTVAMFVDLGLTDAEIARYFHLDDGAVRKIAAGGASWAVAMPTRRRWWPPTGADLCGVIACLGRAATRLLRG